MVKNNIKVFARLKLEEDIRKVGHYQVIKKKSHDNLILKSKSTNELGDKGRILKFRFVKVFDQYSTQIELFEHVARPVVSSVIQGYNGTIFAYGQTGSGKTYTITGSNKFYNDRGVIPRSIEYIFENTHNPKVPCVHNVYVSYLEIYNEVGYDLLTSENNVASRADPLPRVLLLEDGKGESHLRNLTILPVNNMQEAMRLLFLGEANRNSMLTYLLKDSLTGNCYTAMLSTLSVALENRDETLSTCKFGQRVSQVNTDPIMNVEINVQQELELIKQENMELKKEIYLLKRNVAREVTGSENDLTKEDKMRLQEIVEAFLEDGEKGEMNISKYKEMQFCFSLLKDKLKSIKKETCVSKASTILMQSKTHTESNNEENDSFLNQVDDVLSQPSSEVELNTFSLSTSNISSKTRQYSEPAPIIEVLSSKNVDKTRDFFTYTSALQNYFNNSARKLSSSIENYQREIIAIKKGLNQTELTAHAKYKLSAKLLNFQSRYKNALNELHSLKQKSDEVKKKLKNQNDVTIRAKKLPTLEVDAVRNVQCKQGPVVCPLERKQPPTAPLYIANPILVYNTDTISPSHYKDKKSNYYELMEDLLEKTPTKDTTNSDDDTTPNNDSNPPCINEIFIKKDYNKNVLHTKSSESCTGLNDEILPQDEINNNEKNNIIEGNKISYKTIKNSAEINDQEYKECCKYSRSSVKESVCTSSSGSLDSSGKDIVSEFVKKLAFQSKKKIDTVREDCLDVSCNLQNTNPSEKRKRLTDEEFIEFMKTIPLTGDREVDKEIEKFYRQRLT